MLSALTFTNCHITFQNSMPPPYTLSFKTTVRKGLQPVVQHICVGERIEDVLDTMVFYLQVAFGKIHHDSVEAMRCSIHERTGTESDGQPPARIIGVLDTTLFIRKGCDPADVLVCYCHERDCSSEDVRLSI